MNNPVAGNIRLQVAAERTGRLELVLIDLPGKEILRHSATVNNGINQLDIAVPAACSRGVYLLQVQTEQVRKTLKVMIQ